MRIDFFGLTFETPAVTFYLWSPWRCTDIEHRLFKSLQALPGAQIEKEADEIRLTLVEPRGWRAAQQALARVLKGWQEEATDVGDERRTWHWLLEADTDGDGFDHTGERLSMWGFLRMSLERGSPGESVKGEEVDLNGLGLRIWGQESGTKR